LPASEKAKILRVSNNPFEHIYKIPLPDGSYEDYPDKKDLTLRVGVYNGSEWTIDKMMIVIEAKNKNRTTIWKRKFKAKIVGGSIDAFSSGSIIVEPSDAHGVANYIWFIDEAYGYKSK